MIDELNIQKHVVGSKQGDYIPNSELWKLRKTINDHINKEIRVMYVTPDYIESVIDFDLDTTPITDHQCYTLGQFINEFNNEMISDQGYIKLIIIK